jgi:hypothetical protein
MNNTEQFDKWINEAMSGLDTPPMGFRQEALWQKMQAELHPAPKRPWRQSNLRWVAAASIILFCLIGGLWWYSPQNDTELVATVVKPQKPIQSTVTESINPLIAEKPASEIENPQTPNEHPTNTQQTNEQTINKQTTNEQTVNEQTINEQTPNEQLTNAQTINEQPTNEQTITKPVPSKPKFKIVHANELADYQRAEVAEVRRKEAQQNGFVVVNWRQKDEATAQTIRTFIRNQSSKN